MLAIALRHVLLSTSANVEDYANPINFDTCLIHYCDEFITYSREAYTVSVTPRHFL